VNDPNIKELPVAGTFSYLDENQRITVALPPRIVKMGKEVIIVEEIPEAEVSVMRDIKSLSGHLYQVTLNIHYENVSGFAKIQDIVPTNSDVKPEEASDAVFSILNTKVKFVWMNFPEDKNDISVSYLINLENADSKKISDIAGEFAFIHDGESRKIQVQNPQAIDFIDIDQPEQIASISEENTEEAEAVINPADFMEPPVTEDEPVKEIPVTSTPSPESGVTYKVQIMAAHKSVNVKTYFKKNFQFSGDVQIDSHEGWMKYITGGFDNYVTAKDLRVNYRENYSFPGPFVVAYNNGDRITVQEALMITNQKWVN
jgi:hypothetical protein